MEEGKSHGGAGLGLYDVQGQVPTAVLRPANQGEQEVK